MVDIEKIIEEENIILKKLSFRKNSENLKQIFDALDIKIKDFLTKEAITINKNGIFIMFVDTDKFHSDNRLRFTLAHEYAHIKLGHLDENLAFVFQDELTRMGADRNEIAANKLASQILMPKDIIEYYISIKKSIYEISKSLKVSESALIYRMKNLGYIIRYER